MAGYSPEPTVRAAGDRRERRGGATAMLPTEDANRGVLMTPFHNMALMSPATTRDDVGTVLDVLRAAVGELL